MKKASLEIALAFPEPGQTMFRTTLTRQDEPAQIRGFVNEASLRRYLVDLNIAEGDAKKWIKRAKANGSVLLDSVPVAL